MLYTPAEKVDDEPPDSVPSLAQLVSASHPPEQKKEDEKKDDEDEKKKEDS